MCFDGDALDASFAVLKREASALLIYVRYCSTVSFPDD